MKVRCKGVMRKCCVKLLNESVVGRCYVKLLDAKMLCASCCVMECMRECQWEHDVHNEFF